MCFIFVTSDFVVNAGLWQRPAVKIGLGLYTKCSATIHLFTNPDLFFSFHVFKV